MAKRSFGKGGKYQNDRADENLKGQVMSCTEFVYNTSKTGADVDSDYYYKMISTDNRQGNRLSEFVFNGPPNKRCTLYLIAAYDSLGREYLTKDQTGELVDSTTYAINNNGNLIEIIYSSFSTTKLVYNIAGRRDTLYNRNNGRYLRRVIYLYNKDLDLTEEIWYHENGEIEFKIVKEYDKNHHVKDEIRVDSLGKTANKMAYVYDEKGNIIQETESASYRMGSFGVYEIAPTSAGLHKLNCRYSLFDKNNNWLQEDALNKNQLVRSTIRRIEYYK